MPKRLGELHPSGRDLIYRSTFGPSGKILVQPFGTRRWQVHVVPESSTKEDPAPSIRIGVLRVDRGDLLYRSSYGPYGELLILPQALAHPVGPQASGASPPLRGWIVSVAPGGFAAPQEPASLARQRPARGVRSSTASSTVRPVSAASRDSGGRR